MNTQQLECFTTLAKTLNYAKTAEQLSLSQPAVSRGHHIVPVNDELDNIICATTSEAYNLALAGAGFALIPEHLILPHKELVFNL